MYLTVYTQGSAVVVIIFGFLPQSLTRVSSDGVHYCGRDLRLSLLFLPLLHGFPGFSKHQWQKDISACHV